MKNQREVLKIWPDAGNAPWLWSNGACVADSFSGAHGYGLSLELQMDVAEWAILFETNQLALLGYGEPGKEVVFDWDEFHTKGFAIAKRFQEETGGLYDVYYTKPSEDPNHATDTETLIENKLEGRKDRTSLSYNGQVSIAFSNPCCGWVQMVIMHDSFLQNHIIYLSEAFDPFTELIQLVNNVAQGNCKQSITINEEGYDSYIYINSYEDDWLEFRVETDNYNKKRDCNYPVHKIYGRVDRIQFVHEFYRKFQDYLANDHDVSMWERDDENCCGNYLNDLNLQPMKDCLSGCGRPLSPKGATKHKNEYELLRRQ